MNFYIDYYFIKQEKGLFSLQEEASIILLSFSLLLVNINHSPKCVEQCYEIVTGGIILNVSDQNCIKDSSEENHTTAYLKMGFEMGLCHQVRIRRENNVCHPFENNTLQGLFWMIG